MKKFVTNYVIWYLVAPPGLTVWHAAYLVHPPLHAPQVRPHVDEWKDDTDAMRGCLRQYQVQALEASFVIHPELPHKQHAVLTK